MSDNYAHQRDADGNEQWQPVDCEGQPTGPAVTVSDYFDEEFDAPKIERSGGRKGKITLSDFHEDDEPAGKIKEAFTRGDDSVTQTLSNVTMTFTPLKRQDINMVPDLESQGLSMRVRTNLADIFSSDDFGTGDGSVLLKGVVGSTAYGLATEDSDVDYAGVFAVDTKNLHGLADVTESLTYKDPDTTLHEAKKWCSLALKCNPSVLELLWLPDELYKVRTTLGNKLIDIRSSFLSRGYVRNAYLGYATQQLKKIETRGDGSFSADTRKRTAKHGRHLYRLLMQGYQLYTMGTMNVRLTAVQRDAAFIVGKHVEDGDLKIAKDIIATYEDRFNVAHDRYCVLPDKPDTAVVEAWLQNVRREML